MDLKVAQSRKRLYGFIAVTLVLCISISVFLSLGFSSKAPVQSPESDAQPEATTPNQAADGNAGDNGISSSNASTSMMNSQSNSLITEEEALKIAMPLIEQYAKENNRTIITVNATFASMRDIEGLRGGPSLFGLTKENISAAELQNINWSSYPVWTIGASFERVNADIDIAATGKMPSDPQYYIYGFSVSIWADNGQIYYAEPQGIM